MAQNYNLTQTGEEVQELLNQVTPNETAIAQIQEAITAFVNTQQVQTLIATVLQPYSTTEEMTQAISTAITSALTVYYTKTTIDTLLAAKVDKVTGKHLSTEDFTTALKTKLDALPTSADLATQISTAITNALTAYYTKTQTDTAISTAVANEASLRQQAVSSEQTARAQADTQLQALITNLQNQLANYYLKSETYTKSEVQQLVDNVRQFQYKVVDALPEIPSADTVGWIYLVPSDNPKTKNVKEEYITILEGSTYKWEHIGSTNIDLSGYSTTAEMNAAIASALTAYYTKTQVDALLEPKQTAAQVAAAIATALTSYSTTTQMNAAIANAISNYYTKTEVTALIKALRDGIEDGSIVAALADNIASWADRSDLSVNDTWTDVVRTTAGEESILSDSPAKIVNISARTDFYASALKATGFNLLHDANVIGSGANIGYYFLVPALPWGQYGQAVQPNGVLFTNSAGENLKPTVRFKALSAGVPTSISDGSACAYTDSNGLRFFTTTQAGYIIVSGITLASTCAHIAWSRRYNEFVSPTEASDAGSSVTLSSIINAVHSYNLLLNVASQVADGIEFSGTTATWTRRCDRVKPTWTTEAETDSEGGTTGGYVHTATISGMKENGSVECGSLVLAVEGTTISYRDRNADATTDYVKYELATAVTGSVSLSSAYDVEDWGLEELVNANGSAYVTTQYAQSYPDSVAALVGSALEARLKVLVELLVSVCEEAAGMRERLANLGECKAECIDFADLPKVCGQPLVIEGAGAPATPVVPVFVGQRYHDTANKKVYEAFSVTNAISDWVLLN